MERFSSRRGQTFSRSVAIRISSVRKLEPVFERDEKEVRLTDRRVLHILVNDFSEFCYDDTGPGAELEDCQRFRSVLPI